MQSAILAGRDAWNDPLRTFVDTGPTQSSTSGRIFERLGAPQRRGVTPWKAQARQYRECCRERLATGTLTVDWAAASAAPEAVNLRVPATETKARNQSISSSRARFPQLNCGNRVTDVQ
jgi:hypothetical protein